VAGATTGAEAVAVIAVGIAVVFGFLDWVTDQRSVPLDLSSAASPRAVLAGDRRTGTALGAGSGFVFGLVFGVVVGAVFGTAAGVVAGIAVGVAFGALSSFDEMAWPSYGIARTWLGLRRRLPWPLMDFLADAHGRGVLRQEGAVYQFRHIELQHRLANRDATERQADSSTA